MRMVFRDAVGVIALFDEDDQWHVGAADAFEKVRSTGGRRQQGRLLEVIQADEKTAWSAYQAGSSGDAGIVDHISFAVMTRLGIRQAFTNDSHFRAAGFETLF
jgi:predicted nucleic acid-binding protein